MVNTPQPQPQPNQDNIHTVVWTGNDNGRMRREETIPVMVEQNGVSTKSVLPITFTRDLLSGRMSLRLDISQKAHQWALEYYQNYADKDYYTIVPGDLSKDDTYLATVLTQQVDINQLRVMLQNTEFQKSDLEHILKICTERNLPYTITTVVSEALAQRQNVTAQLGSVGNIDQNQVQAIIDQKVQEQLEAERMREQSVKNYNHVVDVLKKLHENGNISEVINQDGSPSIQRVSAVSGIAENLVRPAWGPLQGYIMNLASTPPVGGGGLEAEQPKQPEHPNKPEQPEQPEQPSGDDTGTATGQETSE